MTDPTPPLPPKLDVRIENIATRVVVILVGVILFVIGMFAEIWEIKAPPTHTVHIVVWAVFAIFGLLLAIPNQTLSALQKFAPFLTPYISKLTGSGQS